MRYRDGKYHYRTDEELAADKAEYPVLARIVLYPILMPIVKLVHFRNKRRSKTHCLYCGEKFQNGDGIIQIRFEYESRWLHKPKEDVERYCLLCGAEHTKLTAHELLDEPEQKERALAFAKRVEDNFWGRK